MTSADYDPLDWLAAVMACDLSHSVKVIAYWLGRHSTWQTGRDAWPSRTTLAKQAACSEATAKRALQELEARGFIRRTGIHRPKNCTDYALRIPLGTLPPKYVSQVSGDPTATPDSEVTCDLTTESQLGHRCQPVRSLVSASPVTSDLQPPMTSYDLLNEEEDQGTAPDPEDRVTVVRQILPPSWRALTIQAGDPGLGVLDELQAAGWSARDLRAACESLPVPRKHPTGLLVSHLRQLRGQNPATLTTVGSPNSHPAPVCPHDLDRRVYCRDCEDEKAVPQLVQGVAL